MGCHVPEAEHLFVEFGRGFDIRHFERDMDDLTGHGGFPLLIVMV